jgi:hypothetical protein
MRCARFLSQDKNRHSVCHKPSARRKELTSVAEMVLTPPLRADGREPNFLQKFGHAFVHGDIFTKLSLFVWGLGYIGHGQLIKALLVTLVQGLGLYFLGTSGIFLR